jgi:PAS domain S-box-containing protein
MHNPDQNAPTDLPRVPLWLCVLLFFMAYIGCAMLGHSLMQTGNFVSFWLPSGLFVATLLLQKQRHWLWFVLAALLANLGFDLWNGQQVHISLLFGCGNSLEAFAGAWLVRRFVAERPAFASIREMVGFVFISAFLSTTLSATMGSLVVSRLLGGGSLWSTWLLWWSGDVLGVLLLAPFVLTWLARPSLPLILNSQWTEGLTLLAIMCPATIYVFLDSLHHDLVLKYLMIPLVLWAALRFGARMVSLVNLVVALIAAWLTVAGVSDLATVGLSPRNQVIALQLFLAVVALTGLCVAALMSERKQAEARMVESERRFREMLETVHLFAVILEKNHKVVFCNDYFLRVTGWSREEVKGADWFEFFVPVEERAHLRAQLENSLSQGHTNQQYEGIILTRGGKLRRVIWDNTVLKGPDGAVVGTARLGRDITEQAQLEEQYLQAQKMEAVGQLAGGIAHDFNNILQGITGFVEFARAGLLPHSQPFQDLIEVSTAVERARVLVRQLLTFSRREKTEKRYCDLSTVVGGMIKMLHRVIGEHVQVKTSMAGGECMIYADAGQIEQALMNLCVNARDAMPEGGEIRIELDRKSIDAEFHKENPWAQEGEFVELKVSDTGKGMTPEILEHIFEPFFTTKEVGRGTGLGLATVYGIAKQHDGFLHVESEIGRGSIFHLFLPVVQGGLVEEQTGHSKEMTMGRGEMILLAEDDERVRRVAERTLREAGYRVLVAQDGEEALRIFEEERAVAIQLVLLDVVMPRLSGKAAGEKIRAMNSTVPIVYITGYDFNMLESGLVPEAREGVIQKPFDQHDLLRKVREWLDRLT